MCANDCIGANEKLTNREILDINLENGLIDRCVSFQFSKLPKEDWWKRQYKDDLYQDLIMVILCYDNDKLNDAHRKKHDNALITRIIQNQIYSKTSSFYLKYLRFNMQTNDLEDIMEEPE